MTQQGVVVLSVACMLHFAILQDSAAALQSHCDEPARLYIDAATVTGWWDGTFTVYLGDSCVQGFTFAAGSTAPDFAVAINSFTHCHGMVATAVIGDDFARLKLESIATGGDASAVAIQVCCDAEPLLYTEPEGGTAMYEISTVGVSHAPADLDCNGQVDVADLLLLLATWGPCADPETCHADLTGNGFVGVADLLLLLGQWSSTT